MTGESSARLLPRLSLELQFAQQRGFKSYVSFLLENKVTVLVNAFCVMCFSHTHTAMCKHSGSHHYHQWLSAVEADRNKSESARKKAEGTINATVFAVL